MPTNKIEINAFDVLTIIFIATTSGFGYLFISTIISARNIMFNILMSMIFTCIVTGIIQLWLIKARGHWNG